MTEVESVSSSSPWALNHIKHIQDAEKVKNIELVATWYSGLYLVGVLEAEGLPLNTAARANEAQVLRGQVTNEEWCIEC